MSRKVRFLRGPKEKERRENRPKLVTGDFTLVQQQFRDECDVNVIVRRFGVTGQVLRQVDPSEALYGDFTDVNDLPSALERIAKVEAAFYRLPPEVRERFGNDVVAFAGEALASDAESFKARITPPVAPSAAATAASGGAGLSGGPGEASIAPPVPGA